jgi:uroporphyrinogen-III decarboxylase
MEHLLLDFHEEPGKVLALAEKVAAFPLGVARKIGRDFAGKVHGLYLTDDWGTQERLLVSLETWRRFFYPFYAELFDAIHAGGMHVWLHSCGAIHEIVPEWIALGLDVLNLEQPRLLGLDLVAERYGGKVCIETHCDIQRTLPSGSKQAVREEIHAIAQRWARPEGGLMFCDYEAAEAIGSTEDLRKEMWLAARTVSSQGTVIRE